MVHIHFLWPLVYARLSWQHRVAAAGALTVGGMNADEAAAFCRSLDSIDELVDEINSDGSAVISEPADMAFVLERLALKFGEVAEGAPNDELQEAFRAGHSMFSETASKLREFPSEAKVTEAAQLSGQALASVEELAPAVLEFRRMYCEGSGGA
jgi:hypothetical protein